MFAQYFALLSIASMAAASPCRFSHIKGSASASVAAESAASSAASASDAAIGYAAVAAGAAPSVSASAYDEAAAWYASASSAAVASASSSANAAGAAAITSTWSSAPAATSSAASTSSGEYSGTATYYAAGLGACGWTNSDSDLIVAMNAQQYSSSTCGKNVVITNPTTGQSATAQIADLCPGCSYGDLDMSTSLFSQLNNGNMDAGIFEMTWSYE